MDRVDAHFRGDRREHRRDDDQGRCGLDRDADDEQQDIDEQQNDPGRRGEAGGPSIINWGICSTATIQAKGSDKTISSITIADSTPPSGRRRVRFRSSADGREKPRRARVDDGDARRLGGGEHAAEDAAHDDNRHEESRTASRSPLGFLSRWLFPPADSRAYGQTHM